MKRISLLIMVLLATTASLHAQTFTFGGYAKLDVLATKYHDGAPPEEGPIRDFHFPAQIPVGGATDIFGELNFHAKESRFFFDLTNKLDSGKTLKAFVEMDFLLSGQGDERISNSFNPRLRHFYFSYGKWLLGQTWSTFQVVIMPEDIDFPGAADGIIFDRQPQVRFTAGPWQVSVENPETTLEPYQGGPRIITEAATLPDFVGRHNFAGEWGTFSVAGILRRLNHQFETDGVNEQNATLGWGLTVGGLIKVGEKDDLRFQASGGNGLGRYAAFGLSSGGVVTETRDVEAISSYLGYIGYRHFWTDKLRTNVNVSGIRVDNDVSLTGFEVNRSAYSASVNIIHSPLPELSFGIEYMSAWRKLESGASGRFDRIQFAGKYDFRFSFQKK
jgi:hypothetical protein